MFHYFCAHTFDVSFVCFLRHFQGGSLKEKACFGRKFRKFKILFAWEIYIFIYLKMITWISKLLFFLSPPHIIHTNSAFISWLLFSITSALFQDFLSNQTHRVKIPFWFLETHGSTINSIYELLLLSRAPQDIIDTTVSLSRLFLLLYYKNCKNKW